MSEERGVVGDVLVIVRLNGVLKAVKLDDIKTYKDTGYNIEVYGINKDLIDRFYRLKDVEENECKDLAVVYVKGHHSLSLCEDHLVPVAGPRGLEEKPVRNLKPGDFVFSFVKNRLQEESERLSQSLLLEEKDEITCSRRPEDLAVSLWSLRLSGILSTLAINKLCLKSYLTRRERDRVEKLPMLFFKELKLYLREATRRSDHCRHVYSHLKNRRAVSKRIALHALRDLLELVSSKEVKKEVLELLEALIKLASSNLYVAEVSRVEMQRVEKNVKTYSLKVEKATYVFLGLAPILIT
ncbi:MAG: Hint domain-containing protein [Acidilobaceae archaeon]